LREKSRLDLPGNFQFLAGAALSSSFLCSAPALFLNFLADFIESY